MSAWDEIERDRAPYLGFRTDLATLLALTVASAGAIGVLIASWVDRGPSALLACAALAGPAILRLRLADARHAGVAACAALGAASGAACAEAACIALGAAAGIASALIFYGVRNSELRPKLMGEPR